MSSGRSPASSIPGNSTPISGWKRPRPWARSTPCSSPSMAAGSCAGRATSIRIGMKQSPYQNGQGDIVRDFVNSCRKYGIQPGIYAHMGCNGYLEVDNPGLVNRGKGGDPEKQARYAKICEGMLTELWGNYGELMRDLVRRRRARPGQGRPRHAAHPAPAPAQGDRLPGAGGLDPLDRQRGRGGALSLLGHGARRSRLQRPRQSGRPEVAAGRMRRADPPGNLDVGTQHGGPPLFRGPARGPVLPLRGTQLQSAAQCQSRPGRPDSRAGHEAVPGVRRRNPAAIRQEHRRDNGQRRGGGTGAGPGRRASTM